MSNTDRAWFKRNLHANYRLRRPGDGEVEEIARRAASGAGVEIEMIGGVFPAPAGHSWAVMVVRVGPTRHLRILTLRDVDQHGEGVKPDEYVVAAVAIGERLVMDRIER